ncbi:Asp23 family, cell envelope-related function [Acididesulfobacillus acetoxydans]|uniref:Asp23 family n=1 Tax=Acididesulfobacillus acetoxydans TaxID=1561005 RepID=A0A8S0XCQ5_9FIRM|nr:Asp23/Gls24 family envelope stress response protein [Acididesulfobacillus acetoxydans]KLU61036.1 alkaline shock protein 23 [Peptococcaceae bacterium CEB3]CAA7602746.1 Asp23 family, cell envelope-related function [Acididesulfobacillus acetoxydans]CEJ06397.1 Asp23 family [Acididesulfobacillus acetoxydans]
MGKEISNRLGKIDISEEVIAIIAGAAAVECYGLVGMSSRKITDGFAEILGRENLDRGVVVSIQDDRVFIDLYIIVGYGVRISEVAANVMERVRYTTENLTGLNVSEVNVNVQGVRVLD